MKLLRMDERPKGVKDPSAVCMEFRRKHGLRGIKTGKSIGYVREDVAEFIERLRSQPVVD